MTDLRQKILSAVAGDLEQIESALQQNLNPYLDLVRQVAGHLLFAGGKRLRPLLMVLCARLCNYRGAYDKTFSTAFEFLHAATLLHDDIVDGGVLRRGKPVANSLWGSAIAVLVGDFLLARALSITAGTENLRIIKAVGEITETMSQGEVHQLLKKGDLHLTEQDYLEVIHSKTAVLFQGACRVSAMLADAPAEDEAALSDYGLHLGMAFQMTDDLLDYTHTTGELGKQIGADLMEGKLTLPVIHALQQAAPEKKARMEAIITRKDFSTTEFEELLSLLRKYGGLAYTRRCAAEHIEKAKAAVTFFAPCRTRSLLEDIADYTLTRRL